MNKASFSLRIFWCWACATVLFGYFNGKLYADQDLTRSKETFITQMVRVVNNKDMVGLKQMMSTTAKACLSPDNEKYFEDLLSQELKETIPADAAFDIREISSEQMQQLKRLALIEERIGLHHVTLPTHRLDYSYKNGANAHSTIRMLVLEGNEFKKDYACPTPAWVQSYWKRKDNPEENRKYNQKLQAIVQDMASSLPQGERQSFSQDEYGALYWSMETYSHVWRFKTKATMRRVMIKLIGPKDEERVVMDYDFVKGRMPLDFTLYVGQPKETTDGANKVLQIPYGYSRQGDYPKAESSWIQLNGNMVKDTFFNKIIAAKDILQRSQEITLASYRTYDAQGTYGYALKLFIQTEGSYALYYKYDFSGGKIEAYLSDGDYKFYSDDSLMAWVKTLPAGTHVEVFGTCKMTEKAPLKSTESFNALADACAKNQVQCTHHPGG